MNNLEFYNLQLKLQEQMNAVRISQDQYRNITGVPFINGQEIKEPKFCHDCRFLEDDGLIKYCNCEESEFFETKHPAFGCYEYDEEDGSSIY